MKNLSKKIFYRYKDWMRDVGVFTNEYSTAGRFVNEGIAILTYLAVRGYNIDWYWGIIIYLGALIVMGLLGKVLIWLRVPHYANQLSNEMNPQMVEIIERLKRIEERLNNDE